MSETIQACNDKHPCFVQEEGRRIEGFRTRVTALQHKSADLQKRIRELGTVPMEQVERVRGKSVAANKRELANVQRQLQSHT